MPLNKETNQQVDMPLNLKIKTEKKIDDVSLHIHLNQNENPHSNPWASFCLTAELGSSLRSVRLKL